MMSLRTTTFQNTNHSLSLTMHPGIFFFKLKGENPHHSFQSFEALAIVRIQGKIYNIHTEFLNILGSDLDEFLPSFCQINVIIQRPRYINHRIEL